ncbi:MAG: putative Ig domain-containing protein, partial [Sphingobacteriales bacterium]|nr:putative Ig domain-containing protein [Sphingobacteriales bacterium]
MKLLNLFATGKFNFLFSKKNIALILSLVVMSFNVTNAQTITLSTTVDENNGNVTSIANLIGTPGGAGISLREAILAANNEPVGANITINIPAGNYVLSLAGSDNTGLLGDLDLNTSVAAGAKTVNFQGASSATTTITGLAGERILEIHAINNVGSISVFIDGIRFTGGSVTGSGGAILAGRPSDATTITHCLFDNNTATGNGGSISQSSGSATHNLDVSNTQFSNNTATAVGGAISYSGLGVVHIFDNTFSGNTAGTQGGAINISGTLPGPSVCDILTNTFLNNTANGVVFGGAAVGIVNAGTITINYNRIKGNTAAGVATGTIITTGGGTVTSMNTNNNWWGVNTGPAAGSILGTAAANWLQLKASASPALVCSGSTSTVTAGFLSNSAGNAITVPNLNALISLPISFVNPTLGTLSGAQATIQPGLGTATVIFTAGATAGAGSVNAVVDNVPNNDATATASVTVDKPTVNNPGVNTGTLGVPFSQTFTQSGGTLPVSFSTVSTLPTGLTLSSAGVLSGTPTQSGIFPIVVTVSDNNTCVGTGVTYNLQICPAITVTNPVVATGTLNSPFSQSFSSTGGAPTVTYTTASSLPTGLSLSAAGVLSGTPTVSGTFPITVVATDANLCTGTGSTYTLVINICAAVDQPVSATPATICAGSSSTITVATTQEGINYTLRLDPANTVVAGPTAGTGAAINFTTGALASTTTYNVLAETDKYSVNLDGTQAGFAIPPSAALDLSNNFTIEGWIKPNGNAGFARLFNKDQSYALGISANQTQLTFTRHNAGDFSRPFSFVTGQWYHIACTYVSGTVELFVNGVSLGTVAGVPSIVLQTATGGHIGSDAAGGFNRFNGNIDNVRIWNSVRTPVQIASNQTSYLSSTGNPTLAASWWIIEGLGNAKDYSANAINATALAGTWQVDAPITACNITLTTKPTVTVNPIPNAVATPSSQTTCSAAPITNIVLSGSVGGTVYNWTRNNTVTVTGIAANGSGDITGTLTNTTASPVTVSFTITPSYTNAGVTCTGTPITATVTVNPLPANANITGGGVTVCGGSTVTLSGPVDPNYVYTWGKSLAAAPFTTIGTAQTQAVTSSGVYELIVANQYGCSLTSSTVVQVADYVYNGSIAAGDPQQTGRINRFGVISTCAAPKVCPGINTPTGARFYDAYTITNVRNVPVCATIGLTPTCGNNIFAVAYSGSFNPASPCTNY